MNNKLIRNKTSLSVPTLPRSSEVFSIRPFSAFPFTNQGSALSFISRKQRQTRSSSTLSLWRIVNTAKCRQQLNEELCEPVRKNLNEKMDRLKSKRKEQEQKYEKTLALIRSKCGKSMEIQKEKFEEARALLKNWMDEHRLEKVRYSKRMKKIK